MWSRTPPPPAGDIPTKWRVLIVEDEDAFRNALIYEFERHGFLVSSAENGKKAMEIMRQQNMDVVITDIRMPVVGGIELLEYIKKSQPFLPIVMMMTGFSEISSEDAQARGAEALFSKPFDRRAMTEAVKRLVLARDKRLKTAANSVSTNLKINVHFDRGGQRIESRVLSLSEKGIFVSMDRSFPQVSDDVNFDLHFGDGDIWKAGLGCVKWVCFNSHQNLPPGVGISFSAVSDMHRKKIGDIVKSGAM